MLDADDRKILKRLVNNLELDIQIVEKDLEKLKDLLRETEELK